MVTHPFRFAVVRMALAIVCLGSACAALAQSTSPTSGPAEPPPLKPEELDQLAAPIALYPDALIAQIMMAATYPLEIVQADRWVKANKDLKGDALTAALEKNSWDPSVKSLVNFPQVLDMMSAQLDWTTKFGDAVIASQKDVMEAIQRLRAKAQAAGTLKSTPEQKVIVEPAPPVVVQTAQAPAQVITIQSANPQVIYVPTYNPAVVYGTWPYPTYPPPAPYYPPGYVAGSNLLSFGMGMAAGAAWGYAWGHCDWGHNDVNVDVNRNANINRNINRSNYQSNFQGRTNNNFQHDPSHRKGVSYRDQATAQRLDRGSMNTAKAREDFRGRADAGRQDISRGNIGAQGNRDAGRPNASPTANRPNNSSPGPNRLSTANRPAQTPSRSTSGNSAFNGVDKSGSAARANSNRGQTSRSSSSAGRSAPARSGGGGGRGGGGRR